MSGSVPGQGIRATMHDVAREAGVSIKSVSRVINKEPHVSFSLRERVESAIVALDYVPDTAARSLAGARSFTIGLLFDNPSPHYTMKVLAGAYRACVAAQNHLRIDNINAGAGRAEMVRQVDQILRHSRCDGFVLTPPLCDDPLLLDMLEARGQRYARIAPARDPGRSAAVLIDDAGAAAAIADLFWQMGHRHIALINGPESHGAAVLRRQGFLARLGELDPALVTSQADSGFAFEGGIAAGRELLAKTPRPTAIFAANDDSAAGVMVACQEAGLKVPEDISVCGFDDSWVAKSVWPYLTTIHQPIEEMAEAAVRLLLDRGASSGKPTIRHLDFRFIQRDSVASVP